MDTQAFLLRAAVLGMMVCLSVGCSSNTPFTEADASGADAGTDVGSPDVPTSTDTATPTDLASTTDAADVVTATDVQNPTDVVTTPDVQAQPDVVTAPDVQVLPDVSSPPDVVTATDVPVTTDVPPSVDAGARCTTTADCTGSDMRCGFLISAACSATGTCVMIPTPSGCGAILLESGCGCTGSTVMWTGGCAPQFPAGYAPAPIAHMGGCP